MEAPEKIYLCPSDLAGIDYDEEWLRLPLDDNSIEYIRKDAFIEKACKYWYQYNRDIVKKHGAKAVLGCSEFTVNVEDFKRYMKR